MKKFFLIVSLCTLLSISGPSHAALVSYQFDGTVNNNSFYMGSGYSTPLFSIGDHFSALLDIDTALPASQALKKLFFQVDNFSSGGGTSFQQLQTDFTGWLTSVTLPPSMFVWGVNLSYLNNWALTYSESGNLFSYNYKVNLNDSLPEPSDAYNFNVSLSSMQTVPIPAAVWLLGSGLVGLVAIRRKRTK
jgi:hypothetical protein